MAPSSFSTHLVRPEGVGTWTFAPIPKVVSEAASLRAHQRVKGTIDGVAFGSSIMPRGGGVFFLVVNSELRTRIGKKDGDPVRISIEIDTRPVSVALPSALRKALAAHPKEKQQFDGLAPSHRKAFAQWIASAKQPETVSRRIEKCLQMLRRGETLN